MPRYVYDDDPVVQPEDDSVERLQEARAKLAELQELQKRKWSRERLSEIDALRRSIKSLEELIRRRADPRTGHPNIGSFTSRSSSGPHNDTTYDEIGPKQK